MPCSSLALLTPLLAAGLALPPGLIPEDRPPDVVIKRWHKNRLQARKAGGEDLQLTYGHTKRSSR